MSPYIVHLVPYVVELNGGEKILVIKLVITLDYNLTQYVFVGSEFWQTHQWITFSSYILYTCKIYKKLKIDAMSSINCLNCKFL